MKTQLLEDEILDMMKLENQFGVFNNNMMMLLNDEDKAYVEEIQSLCIEQEEKIGRKNIRIREKIQRTR